MVFARRSLLRAASATRSLRSTTASRAVGRRFYASSHGGEEHKSSDMPWLLGSVGIGGPVIGYLLMSGPEKKPHGDDHGAQEHGKEDGEGEGEESESPPEPVAEESEESKDEQKSGEGKNEPPSAEKKVGAEKSDHDEPAGMKPPAGPTSMSAKQEGLSNTNTMHPHINDEGKSQKGEGETETVKVKGTVKPDRPQQ